MEDQKQHGAVIARKRQENGGEREKAPQPEMKCVSHAMEKGGEKEAHTKDCT